MENKFKYTLDNKRYHTWNYHLSSLFGEKVFKVALNGGFTCPNLDGTKGVGGCTYCLSGSGDFAGNPCHDVVTQFNEVKERMHKKWPKAKYIPYFQANTNTYAPLSVLKEKFEPVLKRDGVVGLSIATRADCLSNEVLDYLEDLSKRTYLMVELGLQTADDKTAKIINRGYESSVYLDAVRMLKKYGIDVVTHIIIGLPGESDSELEKTVEMINAADLWGIKIHSVYVC